MSKTSTWHRLVPAIEPLRPAVRVKWTRDAEPTVWETWIIISSKSYLETGTLGPVPFREVEWVEIDPARGNVGWQLDDSERAEWPKSLATALENAGLSYSIVDGNIRVVADDF